MPPEPPSVTYRAFLSYSHQDTEEAERWHARLEAFPIHDPFRGMPTACGRLAPSDIKPIFRDRVHFTVGAELRAITRQRLDESAALVLLASIASAGSPNVAEEVRYFRHRYPQRPIIPVLIGPPEAAFRAMLPPSLAFLLDADGVVTVQEYNPIAADPRPGGDGLVMATAKVVGRLVGFDDHLLDRWVEDVVRREAERTAKDDREEQFKREMVAGHQQLAAMMTQMTGDGHAAIQAVAEFRALLRPFHPEIDTTPVDKLAKLAQSILDTLRKLGANPNDFAGVVRETLRQAQDHINRLDFAGAAQVLDTELVRSEAQARDRAALLAERGRVARLQLRYRDAAGFYRQARGTVDGIDDRAAWEYAVGAAGALYDQGGEFGDNPALREAIAAYRIALGLAPRERVPLQWAGTQNNLGNALRALGDRESGTKRLEEAIVAYRTALEEWTRDRVPLDWATTQNNLGTALGTLGERESGTARLEEAVVAFRAALKECTRDRVPLNWATTQNNLGSVLRILGERESGTERLEEAAAAHRAALEEWPRDRVPLNWAMTKNNLGAALQALGERESGTERLEEAITAYLAALEEWTRDRVPLNWAMSQNNLGNALQTLGERELGAARLEEAVTAYRAALEERTRDRVPLDWATTKNNLGTALQTLGEREFGTARLVEAVAAYRAALKEWTRDRVPLDWAMIQNNLGAALQTLGARESGTARLEEGVFAYRAALEEWTRDRVSLRWAVTRHNMVGTLALLAERGRDRAALEDAVACARDAVTVFREANITAYLPSALQRVGELEAQLAALLHP